MSLFGWLIAQTQGDKYREGYDLIQWKEEVVTLGKGPAGKKSSGLTKKQKGAD